MSDITRGMINAFLPPGAIWTPKEDEDFDKLLEGMADNAEILRAFLLQLADIRRPSATPIELLSDLETEFGIVTNTNLTEQQRRDQLSSIKFSKGGNGDLDFMEASLRDAGFDVYVHANDPPVDPALLVASTSFIVSGRFNRSAASLTSEDWPLVFFVGGLATRDGGTDELLSIEIASIPIDGASTFKRIIQRSMPMHAWAATAVVGNKSNYFGFDEDPEANGFGDTGIPGAGGYLAELL